MPSQATQDAVAAIAEALADVEAMANTAKATLDELPALFKIINEDPEAGAGWLISKAFSLRARAIGLNFKADIWALHSDLTEAAKLRGIDIPQPRSGGTGR